MKKYFIILASLLIAASWSCKKVKEDTELLNRNLLNSPSSSIRIYNISNGNLNLAVNNIQLTTFDPPTRPNSQTAPLGTELGLSFFPTGVWTSGSDGSPFTVPAGMLNKAGEAFIRIRPGRSGASTNQGTISKDTTLHDDPSNPKDYYLMADGRFVTIARAVAAPVKPDHFKIRILHIGNGDLDFLGLGGAVKLTYANGEEVHSSLSQVNAGESSAYVEVPYGTYQFKLFDVSDPKKQLAELPTMPRLDPCSFVPGLQEGLDPLVRGFKPGGTYTILVNANLFTYSCNFSPVNLTAHAYRIITEIKPPVNSSYARLQFVNTIPGLTISGVVDNHSNDAGITSGNYSKYSTVVAGQRQVQVKDASGKVIAETGYSFQPADNITAWVYEKDNKPALMLVPNAMGAYRFRTGVFDNDGTDGSLLVSKFDYAWQTRFLNLSADLSSVTFTNAGNSFYSILTTGIYGNDTLNRPGSYEKIMNGVVPVHDPYILVPYAVNERLNAGGVFTAPPSVIYVHNSSDGQVPGSLLTTIPAVPFSDFIATPSMYAAGNLPIAETGVYTVALTGRIDPSAPMAAKARLMIVKHNQ